MRSGLFWPPGLFISARRAAIVIYGKAHSRVTLPFHGWATLHPKIIKQVPETTDEAAQTSAPDSARRQSGMAVRLRQSPPRCSAPLRDAARRNAICSPWKRSSGWNP